MSIKLMVNRMALVVAGALLVVSLPAVTGLSVGGSRVEAQANQTEAPAPSESAEETANEEQKVEIKPGDTLSKIAEAYNTTYVRLFNANEQIEDPDVIYPGDTVVIPAEDAELEERTLPTETPVQRSRPAVKAAPKATPAPKQQTVTRTYTNTGSVWDRLAACESSGNWSINTGNGYYGGLQFSLSSWRAVGGSGYPHQASKAEQINRAEKLKAIQGWGAWPACTKKLGLR